MPNTALPVRETLAPLELLDRLVTEVDDEREQRVLTEALVNARSHLRPA